MPKYSRYIASGVRTDCNKLVEKFKSFDTLRYDTFAEIWREMKFSFIFYGHKRFDELLEFVEEAIRIAKNIWLKSDALNEQTCGLYLVYGLYFKQPTCQYVKIRLSMDDMLEVLKFHTIVRDEDHHDANFILSKLFLIGAFRYCLTEHTYGIEKSFRKYHEYDRSLKESKDEPAFIKSLKNNKIFEELKARSEQYQESKCKLLSPHSKTPPALLNYANPNFADQLLKKFSSIMQVSEDDTASQKNKSKIPGDSIDEKLKHPWWMLPVNNKIEDDLSSDSEDEDSDVGEVKPLNKRQKKAALNSLLDLSGNDDECCPAATAENTVDSMPGETAGPSGGNKPLDMPIVF